MKCRLSLENKNGKHVSNDDDGCFDGEEDDEIATAYNMI